MRVRETVRETSSSQPRSTFALAMRYEPPRLPPVSGNARRVLRRRGAVWYVKYRVPDPTRPGRVRQVEKMLGPEWPEKGPAPPGYFDRRSAQEALEAILTDARRGAIELARTGVTFEQAAIEWLRWGEHERGWKRSTLVDRRSLLRCHLLPEFGALPITEVTTRRVEAWKIRWLAEHDARRQGAKLLAVLHGIMERARRAYDLPRNPVADVDRIRVSYDAARFDFYSPEEVYALARAAASEQDAALFLTAAFAGLRRGELVALRWRDVDFAKRSLRVEGSFSHGAVTTTKGGRARAVPLVAEVAQALARLGQRDRATGRDDPVFPGDIAGHLDASALRRRFVCARDAAALRPLRFHDLRHTFGSLAINRASIVQVQAWMGHADAKTTMRYLHHKSQENEAELLADAFRPTSPPSTFAPTQRNART
jgi:integrase